MVGRVGAIDDGLLRCFAGSVGMRVMEVCNPMSVLQVFHVCVCGLWVRVERVSAWIGVC